jgi:quercetin dioxygenase-like cupin family protein
MKVLDPRRAATEAVTANASRPATAIVHDSDDARLVVFRLAPGQAVAPHRSNSTVMLSVLGGSGFVSGSEGERDVSAGDLVVYAPDEVHGMRAGDEELTLLATIAPRPGSMPASIRKAEPAGRATVSGGGA